MKKLLIISIIALALFLTWYGEKHDWGEGPPSAEIHKSKTTKKNIQVILNKEYPKGHPLRNIVIIDGDTVQKDEEYYKILNGLKQYRDSL